VITRLSAILRDDSVLMTVGATAINVLYEESDRGLWDANAAWTNLDQVTALAGAEELAIAQHDARLTRVVRVRAHILTTLKPE
jgi:hypothetical protein